MTLTTALEWMDTYYDRLRRCTSTSGRRMNGKAMYSLYREFPEMKEYWDVDMDYICWEDRFTKKERKNTGNKTHDPSNFTRGTATLDNVVKGCINILSYNQGTKYGLEDGINFTMPEISGLYMIGETTFNPYNPEKKFYGIKVGKAKNLKQRIASYKTCGLTPFIVDYLPVQWDKLDYAENVVHNTLHALCLYLNSHNQEWFYMDEDTYKAICEKGFNYFN